jgi:peptidyl-tRNA hydrolase
MAFLTKGIRDLDGADVIVAALNTAKRGEYKFSVVLSRVELDWIRSSFKKVTLQVNSEEELLEIERKAKEAGLEVHVITDSGLTEFNGVPTKTCLAIGPDEEDKINAVTGHLKLY